MKFTIGYTIPDLDEETIYMSEDGKMCRHLEIKCPNLPEDFYPNKEAFSIREDMKVSVWIIEINSLGALLELARKINREITIERQPAHMRDTFGRAMPEFSISIGEKIE